MKFVKPMSRSVYKVRYEVKGSFNLGEICPIGAPIEVIPADGFKLDVYSVLRMATPIAPIMDDLDAEVCAFYVPLRLIGNKTWGDMTSGNGQISYVNPPSFEAIIGNGTGNPADWTRTNIEAYSAPTEYFNPSHARSAAYTTIGEALGLGLGLYGSTGTSNVSVSAYQLYGINLIYQEHFRNENVETVRTLDKTSNVYGVSGEFDDTTDDSSIAPYNQALNVAYKHGDMFTNAIPNPQKGPSIKLPLGTEAPLKATGTTYALGGTISFGSSNTTYNVNSRHDLSMLVASQGSHSGGVQINDTADSTSGSFSNVNLTNLYADLSNATAATVNSFIEAYNVQQLLMNDVKGTRYYEQILSHFAVQNEDIKLYRPEILSINRFPINVSTVVQQSGTSTSSEPEQNYLGSTGGYSMTAHKDHAVSQDFGEYGLIYLTICVRQKHTYGSGIPKQYLRSTRFDWFFPELGRLGWQEIAKKRLDSESTSTTPYAYEPAWQELRDVNHNQVFGLLNPVKANALDYWTLAEQLTALPTLSVSFLKESRDNLARALCIADQGPDFIMDAMIIGTKSTLVPVANTPKLFD